MGWYGKYKTKCKVNRNVRWENERCNSQRKNSENLLHDKIKELEQENKKLKEIINEK